MKKLCAIAAAAVLWAVFLCPVANATIGCTTENPHQYLTTELKEYPLLTGLSSRGAKIIIYAGLKSWSIIARIDQDEGEIFCVLDIGSDLLPVESKKKGI